MKKTILATAIALASASAFATGGGGNTAADASISGAGFLVGGSTVSAVSTGNGASSQISGSSADLGISVNANTMCRDGMAGARLESSTHGSTEAFAAGDTIGSADGMGAAGALQASGVHGSANVRASDRAADVDAETWGGPWWAPRNGNIEAASAGGRASGSADLVGAQGSAAGAMNIGSGEAHQISGAGFDNEVGVLVGVDASAPASQGPATVDMKVRTQHEAEGYSYAGGIANDAIGGAAAGYMQGTQAEGSAYGGATEDALTWRNYGQAGSNDLATAEGGIRAESAQGSAGGALNIQNGFAENASRTAAEQKAYMNISVDATPADGASTYVNADEGGLAEAATYTNNNDAIGGTLAGAGGESSYGATEYVRSDSHCYSGNGCRR